MDLTADPRLRGGMDAPLKTLPYDDLLRQLFFLTTALFEDGATIAADGQAAGIAPDLRIERANRLLSLAQEVTILAAAVIAISGASIVSAGIGADQ